ncbi:MAG: hypothetical protein ACYCWW_00390 [Deltaproteobacteria bacterium]
MRRSSLLHSEFLVGLACFSAACSAPGSFLGSNPSQCGPACGYVDCVGGACGPVPCSTSSDCPQGMTCDAKGQCNSAAACDPACGPSQVCTPNGLCVGPGACPGADVRCQEGVSYCANIDTDPNDCGGCGLSCERGMGCTVGQCGLVPCQLGGGCPLGESCQGGYCGDTSCSPACPTGQTCLDTECVVDPNGGSTSCTPGETLCDTPSYEYCTDIQTNVQDCGNCGVTCPVGAACQGAACVAAPCSATAPCQAGLTCQGGYCVSNDCPGGCGSELCVSGTCLPTTPPPPRFPFPGGGYTTGTGAGFPKGVPVNSLPQLDPASWALNQTSRTEALTAVNWPDGHLEVFARTLSGQPVHVWSDPSGLSWRSPSTIPTQASCGLAAAVVPNGASGIGRLFMTDSGGSAKVSSSLGGWQTSEPIGGQGLSHLTPIARTDGTFDLFGVGVGGQLVHNWQSTPEPSGWTGWADLQGQTGDPEGVSAIQLPRGDPRLRIADEIVLARNQQGHASAISSSGPGRSDNWHGASTIGANLATRPIPVRFHGTIWLVARDKTGRLRVTHRRPNGGFTGWSVIAGTHEFVGLPSMTIDADRLMIAARDRRGAVLLMHRQSSGQWVGPHVLALSGNVTAASDPLAWNRHADGRAEVFVVTTQHELVHARHEVSGQWLGWRTLARNVDDCRSATEDCPFDGDFCGGDMVTGNPNTLYECLNGVKTPAAPACANGCEFDVNTLSDVCKVPATQAVCTAGGGCQGLVTLTNVTNPGGSWVYATANFANGSPMPAGCAVGRCCYIPTMPVSTVDPGTALNLTANGSLIGTLDYLGSGVPFDLEPLPGWAWGDTLAVASDASLMGGAAQFSGSVQAPQPPSPSNNTFPSGGSNVTLPPPGGDWTVTWTPEPGSSALIYLRLLDSKAQSEARCIEQEGTGSVTMTSGFISDVSGGGGIGTAILSRVATATSSGFTVTAESGLQVGTQ